MLRDNWLIVAVMVIALAAGGAYALGTAIRDSVQGGGPLTIRRPDGSSGATPTRAPFSPGSQARVRPQPGAPPSGARGPGWELLTAGRLRASQEEFLQILLTTPGNQEAMEGLVLVRRRLANHDPVVLRRQAAAYQQAMLRRTETEEHFTVDAMALLVKASLIAAQEIEAERAKGQSQASVTPVRPTATPRAAVTPKPSPRAAVTPKPSPVRPTPPAPRASALPTPQVRKPLAQVIPTPPPPPQLPRATAVITPAPQATRPEPPVDLNEPFMVVRVGPIADAGRVSEIMGELTLAGYSASVSRRDEPASFHVVSEALARDAAERRAQVLFAYGFRSRINALAGGLAQLEFGTFSTADEAEVLASRIRTRGYHAMVAREGGVGYIITAGPYRQTVASAIVRIVRARFGSALGVTVSAAP